MTAQEAEDPLLERLLAFVGAPSPAVKQSQVAVNEAMVRHWCDALEDRNPVYLDPEAAAGSVHGGRIAPPAMLQSWCMEGRSSGGEPIIPQVMALLEEAGYPSVVATNYDQEYDRVLREGDRLSEVTELEEVSPRKTTGLGEGYFVTFLSTYRDADGEIVGRSRMRVLKFRAAPRTADEGKGNAADQPLPEGLPRPRPVTNRDNAFFWEGVDAKELRIQRCTGCQTLRHPPAPMCAGCGELGWDWVVASGRGTVHSYVVHHHPPLPGFSPPFVVVLVDLQEGTRFVSNLLDTDPADVRVGQQVELVFERADQDLVLPLFRRVGA